MPLVTTWTSGGGTFTVRTPQQPGEDPERWQQRHETAVEEMQELFPPD